MEKRLPEKKGIYSALSFSALIKKGLATLLLSMIYLLSMAATSSQPPDWINYGNGYAKKTMFDERGGALPPDCTNYGNGDAINIVYSVNGSVVPTLNGFVYSGDTVKVCFNLSSGSDPTLFSLVSYSAPDSTFDPATAYLQTVFDSETQTLSGIGTLCLSVIIPGCYFQLDFVKGCVIEQLGPDSTNNFYSSQGRLIASETGGSGICNCVANADAGPDANMYCDTTFILTGSTTTHNPVISWQALAGGNIVSGDTTLNPVINAGGTYVLKVTDTLGCSAFDTVKIAQSSLSIDLGNDTTIYTCIADSIILDAGLQGPGIIYSWSTGASTQTIVVTVSGTYYVKVGDSLGCVGRDTIVVNIINNAINLDLGPDTTVCGCIQLYAGNPGATYTWCSGQNYSTINACTSGMYCVTVSNGTCTAADTVNIIVHSPPVVDLGNDTTICNGLFIMDAGNPGATYMWNTGATTQLFGAVTTGTYYVTVTDTSGCSASDTIIVSCNLGVAENPINNYPVGVYPNPSSDNGFIVNFEMPEKGDAEIRILNVLGAVVYSETLKDFKGIYQKKITWKDLAAGIYFVDVKRGTQQSVTRVAINK